MERLTTQSILGGWTLKVPRQEAVDRLAAYKDTGLEPEEIRSLRMDMTIIKAMFGDADVKHMKELCEADKEGRLVVLPCKVGETLYTESPVKGMITSFEAPDLVWIIENISEFGKTVFLTRAEAEAAIGGGGDG